MAGHPQRSSIAARPLAGRVVVGDPAVRLERTSGATAPCPRSSRGRRTARAPRPAAARSPARAPGRRGDRIHEFGLVRERGVVDERDRRASRSRLTSWRRPVSSPPGNGVPSGQHKLSAFGQPVDEVERRVAEGAGDRVPHRRCRGRARRAGRRRRCGQAGCGARRRGTPPARARTRRGRGSRAARLRPRRPCRRPAGREDAAGRARPCRGQGRAPAATRPANERNGLRRSRSRRSGVQGKQADTLRTSLCAVSLPVTAIVLVQPEQLESGCSSTSSCASEPTMTSAYVPTTSQTSRRPWRRPVGYASSRWMNAPRARLPTSTPRVKTQSLSDSASAPRNQRYATRTSRKPVTFPGDARARHAGDEERQPDREGEREERAPCSRRGRSRGRAPCRRRPSARPPSRDQGEGAGPHPSKSASAAPPSSALGMKPRAPLCSISPP